MGEKVRRGHLTYWVSLRDAVEYGDPRQQRNSSALESPPYFCTTANLQSAVVYLSQELQGMGLGCPFIETEGQKVNLVALLNACWEVTQLYRKSVRDTNVLQDQHRRTSADINHFQISIKDLRGEVKEKERLIGEVQEKERRTVIDNKALATKLKREKEEVRRLGSVVQQRDTQCQHELKKKEMENNQLKDRLHKLSCGRSSDIRQPTLNLSSTLSRANQSRGKWKTEASSARHVEELNKRVLGHYETWIGQLNDENEQLKSSLLSISAQIAKLVNKYCKVDTPEMLDGAMNTSMASSTFSTDSLENSCTHMEFPAYKDRVQETNNNLRIIAHYLEEVAQNTDNSCEKQLKKQLEDLGRKLNTTKEELTSYKYAVENYYPDKSGENESSFLVEGRYVEEELSLEMEKQKLARERNSFEKEKKLFTEAAIRLNRERASFEAEKGECLRDQFLHDLPLTLSTFSASGDDDSSGSIGEALYSPKCNMAVPSFTSPTGNITYVQGEPPVLVSSGISKQTHYCYKGRGSSRRL